MLTGSNLYHLVQSCWCQDAGSGPQWLLLTLACVYVFWSVVVTNHTTLLSLFCCWVMVEAQLILDHADTSLNMWIWILLTPTGCEVWKSSSPFSLPTNLAGVLDHPLASAGPGRSASSILSCQGNWSTSVWGIEDQLPALSCQHYSGRGFGFTLPVTHSGWGEDGMKISCMVYPLKLESSHMCLCVHIFYWCLPGVWCALLKRFLLVSYPFPSPLARRKSLFLKNFSLFDSWWSWTGGFWSSTLLGI